MLETNTTSSTIRLLKTDKPHLQVLCNTKNA